jgi:predicted adenine nucleotide alpha hydrolase (AANH) superfamily ATPase
MFLRVLGLEKVKQEGERCQVCAGHALMLDKERGTERGERVFNAMEFIGA